MNSFFMWVSQLQSKRWTFTACFELVQGIRVQVKSVYLEGRSQPTEEVYFFEYKIRITNNTNRPVQLLRRHWIITDANGKTENFWWVNYSCVPYAF